MKRVLRIAIRLGGTGVDSPTSSGAETGYYNTVRMLYQRAVCPCGYPIVQPKIGGRSAHFCPVEEQPFCSKTFAL